jgi:O-methyltransferase domain
MPDGAAAGEAILREVQRSCWQWAALKGIVSVGVPELLADGPLPVAELADRCGADAPTLARLLRSVAGLGLVRSVSPGTYELTEAGGALLGSRELHAIEHDLDPEISRALSDIVETVRTGQSPFTQRHGSLYDYLAAHPDAPGAGAFDKLMTANHGQLATELARADQFDGLRTLVDVGGGVGTFLAEILRAHPDLRGTLVELDRAVPAAKEYLTARGVGGQAEVVGGDFFEAVPAGADAYLLAHILHNWDDARAIAILRVVRAAMPSNARLLIVEVLLPDDDSSHFGKDLDVVLLTVHFGQERSKSEYDALLTAAGFTPGPLAHLAYGTFLLTAT